MAAPVLRAIVIQILVRFRRLASRIGVGVTTVSSFGFRVVEAAVRPRLIISLIPTF